MERLQQAMDRFRQQSDVYGSRDKRASGTDSFVPPPIVYRRTRSVELDEADLRKRRVLAGYERGPFVEGYRILRTQVLQRMREQRWNVLAVSSPQAAEGKTLTAVNLAVAMAMEARQTVLLVDADLRHPGVHAAVGIDECRGLADYLLDDAPVEDLLVHPGVGRLVILPAGRAVSRSAELLTSPKMVALVEELRHRYPARVIVFDLPPLLSGADALAFLPQTDALLLVIEEGRSTVSGIEQALSLVGKTVPLLGTVLNKSGRANLTRGAMSALLSS